ncbi:GAF and ANTAR domain-containing protein [Nocardioides sp.]|uniref:GAF and ANTAR domain-containing protein n=1 Tax=Nocardioides sp. TaxID=35761 RepID=UPI00286E0A07|nr:GAF and ANTAR domain-containing protein [Nocardioides sp.]
MSLSVDAESFAELAVDLHEVTTPAETVERIVEFAAQILDCVYAGVILVHEGSRVETVASDHDVVSQLDLIQWEAGEGPDLDLIADRPCVIVRDVRTETRWPTWCAAVDAAGVRSMIGARLSTTRQVLGSLNLYAHDVDAFGSHDLDVAHMLARHAAVALEAARGTEHLLRAIEARNLIGQAQGILMERHGLDAGQAFAVLRRHSQHTNVKLHVVARQLIETRSLPH